MKILDYKKRILLVLFLTSVGTTFAQIKLPQLISDNAILQRDTELKIWGWADNDEKVTLNFNGEEFTTTANEEGKWEIDFPAQKAGGPYKMTFSASNKVEVNNILFGDVYLGSGQSNMETTMERVSPLYPEVIANSENEEIRQFLVPDEYNFKNPAEDLSGGSWRSANPGNLKEFSAVGYFFATEIYKNQNVPVGFINSAVGGSPINAWLDAESLKNFPKMYKEHQKYQNDSLIKAIEEENSQISTKWNELLSKKDKGLTEDYVNASFDDWETTQIPGYWKEANILDSAGVVWYKKEITLSEKPEKSTAELNLGVLIDSDKAYVNGTQVGTTGYQYPPRRYKFNSNILKEGKNIITVRLVNNGGTAGFVDDKTYFIEVDSDSIGLKGKWKYKIGATMPNMKPQRSVRFKPGGLHNAMIAPLYNTKIKGVLWYQGESDAGNPEMYSKLLPQLITSWRGLWKKPDLPFLLVQLPNFMEETTGPQESNWAEMREVQRTTGLNIPNTGMAVTIDIGEWNDIHPLNKKDVGKRLALQARELIYGEKLVSSGPAPSNWKIDNGAVMIDFDNLKSGWKFKDGNKPTGFTISEDGKTFYDAKAQVLDDNTLKIYNHEIKNPGVVRYAWANNPGDANLYNKEDLPAGPFELKITKENN